MTQPSEVLSLGKAQAQDVVVQAYRQILIWPILLKDVLTAAPLAERVQQLAQAPGSQWRVRPLLPTEAAREASVGAPFGGGREALLNEPTFEEIVYFHPFVRDFLYGDGHPDARRRSLFRLVRSDVRGVRVQTDAREHLLDVDRVELYLAKPNVAILVLEVGSQSPLKLADVLELQQRLRHVYPPYFAPKDYRDPNAGQIGGNCPRRVDWLGAGNEVLASSNFDDDPRTGFRARSHFAGFTATGAEPPLAQHWRYLLHPLEPLQKFDDAGALQQIIDERIPGLTYLAVDDPRSIAPGDLDRLVFCEPPGKTPHPYAPEFLAAERGRHAYTRYWHRSPEQDAAGDKSFDTLYLCSSFQFVTLGSAQNCFFKHRIFHHFRQHYLRIGLLVHFHRAALLKFADDLAEAVKLLKDEEPSQELLNSEYADRVRHVLKSFLKFRSRSWFEEVSNQLQGAELYDWWSERVGTERLFREVEALAAGAHSVLLNERTSDLTDKGVRLSALALVVALASLAATAFQLLR